MKLNFTWNSTNKEEQKQYLENKIKEWVYEDGNFNKYNILTIMLSMIDPLENVLNGNIINENKDTICTFQSNEFLDKLIIDYTIR